MRVFRVMFRGVKLDSALTERDNMSNSKKCCAGGGAGLNLHLTRSSGQLMFHKTGLQVTVARHWTTAKHYLPLVNLTSRQPDRVDVCFFHTATARY